MSRHTSSDRGLTGQRGRFARFPQRSRNDPADTRGQRGAMMMASRHTMVAAFAAALTIAAFALAGGAAAADDAAKKKEAPTGKTATEPSAKAKGEMKDIDAKSKAGSGAESSGAAGAAKKPAK